MIKIPKVPWLDHLRGLAAMLVASAHTYYALVSPLVGLEGGLYKASSFLAYQAVYIFFMVSGFAITLSMIGNVTRGGRFAVREYAAARFARLYPPLVLAVLIAVVVWGVIQVFDLHGSTTFALGGERYLLRQKVTMNWGEIITPLLFINRIFVAAGTEMNGSLWSLSFEFWIYVIAGLCCSALINRSRLALVLFFALLALYCYHHRFGTFYFYYLPVWGVGSLMALYSYGAKSTIVRVLFALSVVAAAVTLVACLWRYGAGCLLPAAQDKSANLVHACIAILLCAGLHHSPELKIPPRFFALFDWAAEYSYTLYAIHFPLLLLAMSLIRPHTNGWGIAAMTWVAAGCFVLICLIAWRCALIVEDKNLLRPRLRRWLGCAGAVS